MSDDAITVRIPEYSEVVYCETSSSSSSDNEDVHDTPVNTPQLRDTQSITSEPESESFPVTPLIVGEVMSNYDPFYTPHRDNPFSSRFKDAKAKLIGSLRENWQAWFDLPSPGNLFTPPITPKSGHEDSSWIRPIVTPKLRRSHSLPGSPNLLKKEIDRYQYEAAHYSPSGYRLVRGYPLKASEEVSTSTTSGSLAQEEMFETHSDGSSSADSAVDLMLRDIKRSRKKLVSGRKLAVEASGGSRSGTGEGCVSPAEILTRYLEAKILDDALNKRLGIEPKVSSGKVEERFPHSFSSSESCLSLDECSMLSPTSSYSSYGEDSELWSRAQFEFYEHRLRSREKFQELVRRFEAKQQAASAKKGEEGPASTTHTDTRSLFLHERLEHSDSHLERKFQELRRKWENQEQISSLSLHPKSCHRLSPKPKHTKSSLIHGAKPKTKAAKQQQLSPRPDEK